MSKVINISDNWRVNFVPLNFVLEEKRMTKPSKEHPEPREKWFTYGYYSSLKSALRDLPDALMLSPRVKTYYAAMEEWETLVEALTVDGLPE